jgi:Family of unknown function (DUF5397)
MANSISQPGFSDVQSQYDAGRAVPSVGQIRRFGDAGPAYEILRIEKTGEVLIEVITSGEQVVFPIAEIQLDPLAETIP